MTQEGLYETVYPKGEWKNKCPKCGCVSLNFIYFSITDKWLCPGCNEDVDLYVQGNETNGLDR